MPAKTTAQANDRGNDERAGGETRMRPLYRLDFLRLLKYHELERCRLVNSAYDRTIELARLSIRPTFKRFWLRQIVSPLPRRPSPPLH